MTPGRDLVQLDKKRREARTKGQVTYKCDLLFCSGLHRLFTKEYNLPLKTAILNYSIMSNTNVKREKCIFSLIPIIYFFF